LRNTEKWQCGPVELAAVADGGDLIAAMTFCQG